MFLKKTVGFFRRFWKVLARRGGLGERARRAD
jgi:hypothetical protein